MSKAIVSTWLVATVIVGGCGGSAVGPQHDELAAPPDPFVVTTKAGTRLTGAAARIDIRHASAAEAPDVEVAFSASDASLGTWTATAVAPTDFLQSLALTARVVDRPLRLGEATVQVGAPDGDTRMASTGLLELKVAGRRLTGGASGMSDESSATFEGLFVVTCAVPAGLLTSAPAGPIGAAATLVVDEKFESALCKPYASLAGL